jgi:methionine synthase II (cobalamin-independent)
VARVLWDWVLPGGVMIMMMSYNDDDDDDDELHSEIEA